MVQMKGMEDRNHWEMVAQQKGSLSVGKYAQIVKRKRDKKTIFGANC
jgi:hypothetical protein